MLNLGVHLLARLGRPEDLPRVVEAKQLDFDTFCPIPTEYLLIFGAEAWDAYFSGLSPEQRKAADRCYAEFFRHATPVTLRNWWQHQETRYPTCSADEKVRTRALQAYELGDLATARYWAGEWEAQEADSPEATARLVELWSRLDCPDAALRCLERQRSLWGTTPFDRASFDRAASDLLLQAGRYPEAWELLHRIGQAFVAPCEWRTHGLALALVEQMLELAGRPDCPEPLRRQALELADRLMRDDVDPSHAVLEKAVVAASLAGDRVKVAAYTRRRDGVSPLLAEPSPSARQGL